MYDAVCDKIAEKIVAEPQLLERLVSCDSVSGLIQIDGAEIGYVQFAVSVIAVGQSVLPYLLIAVPVLVMGGAKVYMMADRHGDNVS